MVLVEGASDERLFNLTDRLAREAGHTLLGNDLAFVASGRNDEGGTFGVAREFTTLRSLARIPLDAQGRPLYKVIGLVDYDNAGRRVIADIERNYRGAREYLDVIAIRPAMPRFSSMDGHGRQQECHAANISFASLNWEIEDVLSPRLLELFKRTHAREIVRQVTSGRRTHYEITRNGKAELHRLANRQASLADLVGVIEIVRSVRSMFGLPDIAI